MRPVHVTDLDIAARTVLAYGPVTAVRIVAGARLADRYRKRMRRRHRLWGDGTLAGACAAIGPAAPPGACDAAYRTALAAVLAALAAPL
ncbi:hypothetical protein SAMN04488003_101110 [Loktanella fryxellensis]|uniref:DUF7742 domain-containing protein n=1 Tax=Loktanella fryxellensis TaxID=245187 RepID=A0A1H7YCS5_9RHOB|nr:hypothetical protein [Loktanella fryxellensis]SEM43755.1 hypothetical protein SAMN04488003_101110 [Loktanella fryxellensis]